MTASFTFHHIGCAVPDIETSARVYGDGLGFARRSRTIAVTSQQVRVAFVEVGPSVYVELIEANEPGGKLKPFLKLGYYHVCYLTADLDAALVKLGNAQCQPLKPFQSEAFAGHRCQFVMSPDGHLLELAEMTPDAFAAYFGTIVAT